VLRDGWTDTAPQIRNGHVRFNGPIWLVSGCTRTARDDFRQLGEALHLGAEVTEEVMCSASFGPGDGFFGQFCPSIVHPSTRPILALPTGEDIGGGGGEAVRISRSPYSFDQKDRRIYL
jgi:hypothetical protein